jgi:hypothetical protein
MRALDAQSAVVAPSVAATSCGSVIVVWVYLFRDGYNEETSERVIPPAPLQSANSANPLTDGLSISGLAGLAYSISFVLACRGECRAEIKG